MTARRSILVPHFLMPEAFVGRANFEISTNMNEMKNDRRCCIYFCETPVVSPVNSDQSSMETSWISRSLA